jgi:ABC-type bacteriocin/lantibiotic exporter with double-glycine peptidase domain
MRRPRPGTLRDNVVFGARFDEEKYRQTMRACAMLPDVAALKMGDLSYIGENGLVLSGGQKQVALA